ncbi:hypothetical protein V8E55_011939 [Tylopilus felleus]
MGVLMDHYNGVYKGILHCDVSVDNIWIWIVTNALKKALPDFQEQGLICVGLFGIFLRWNELLRYLLLSMDYFTASAASQTFMSSSFLLHLWTFLPSSLSLLFKPIWPTSVALRHPSHIIN